jgi:hypothetical protein
MRRLDPRCGRAPPPSPFPNSACDGARGRHRFPCERETAISIPE